MLHAPEYDVIDDPDERRRWREAYAARGYGRWPVGPIYGHAYSGQYPNTDWTEHPEVFLARMDELIDDGFMLDFFAIPDTVPAVDDRGNPEFAWLDRVLKPIYQSGPFQERFHDVTIAWEPNWDNATWAAAARWVRGCFPDARIWVHMGPGHSAPGMGSEPEDQCWRVVAPWVNGCDYQSGAFGLPDELPNGRTSLESLLYELWDIARRFAGDAPQTGWPTRGYGGAPLICRAREYASYWVYWGHATEAAAQAWGRAIRETQPYRDPETGALIDLERYQLARMDGAR